MSEEKNSKIKRRDFIQSLATIPVFGGLVAGILAKESYDSSRQQEIFDELGIDLEMEDYVSESAEQKPKELVRLGLIGAGDRGIRLLRALGFFDDSPNKRDGRNITNDLNVTLVGVCDVYNGFVDKAVMMSQRSRSAVHSRENKPAWRSSNYQELLDSNEIDAVIIATPDHWHAQMAVDAAKAGKHIYCEKCLTRTIEEAYLVKKVIKNSPIVFQYGHQNRQQSSFELARRVLQKNLLGKITLIKTHTHRNRPAGAWIRHLEKKIDPNHIDWQQWLGSTPHVQFTPSRFFGWQKFFEYSGGLPAHMFSHEYDAINQILDLGIPNSVMALGGIYYWNDDRNTPDVIQALFNYHDRGLMLTYDATLASRSTDFIKSGSGSKLIYGSDAMMKLGLNFHVIPEKNSKRYKNKINSGLMTPESPFISYDPGTGIDAITSASEKAYASQGLVYTYKGGEKVNVTHLHLKEWLDCIRDGRLPSCNIDRAFEDAITCLMATKSYRERRLVEWDRLRNIVI